MLYRDPQAILLYVSRLWADCGARNDSNVRKWVRLINYVVSKAEVRENAAMQEKGRRMRLEMLAYLDVWHSEKVSIELDETEKAKLAKFTSVFKVIRCLETR